MYAIMNHMFSSEPYQSCGSSVSTLQILSIQLAGLVIEEKTTFETVMAGFLNMLSFLL
jgi:hypothetical protein